MTEAEIKQKLKACIAVKPGKLAQEALGYGRHMLLSKIADGTVPTNGVGNIPANWMLEQMKIRGGKAA